MLNLYCSHTSSLPLLAGLRLLPILQLEVKGSLLSQLPRCN
jgi:hypothetical protein